MVYYNLMKSLKFLFLIVVALFSTAAFFSSCSNEDDELEGSNDIEKIIIGGSLEYVNVTKNPTNENSYVRAESDGETRFHFVLNGKNCADLGYAWIDFFIPTSSFKDGKDVTNDITQMTVRLPASYNDIYTSIGKGFIVKGGKTQITKLTNERATVRFSKFVVQLGASTMNIDGSGSCEIK